MLAEITIEEYSAALDRVADSALAQAGQITGPVDAVALAKSLGLAVIFQPRQQSRAQIVRLGAGLNAALQPAISLRPDPRDERQQWAVAHEIGEHLAHQVFAELGVDPRTAHGAAREQVANRLASRLLLPREPFLNAARKSDWDLLQLKRQFSTASHELIARRMLDFPEPVLITIFDQGKQFFRASNQAARAAALNRCERQAWQAAHDTGVSQRAGNRCFQVQVWPIHENSWKREILRTTWSAAEDCEVDPEGC